MNFNILIINHDQLCIDIHQISVISQKRNSIYTLSKVSKHLIVIIKYVYSVFIQIFSFHVFV